MDGVSYCACSKLASNLLSNFLPLRDGILGYKFHAGAHIGLQKLGCLCTLDTCDLKETLRCGRTKLAHLQPGDRKPVLVNQVNDLTRLDVDIRFDKCKRRLFV